MRTIKRKSSTSNLCLSTRYSQFIEKYNNLPEKKKIEFVFKFIGTFDLVNGNVETNENMNLKIVLFGVRGNEELRKLMLEVGDKGVDLRKISGCIAFHDLSVIEKKKHPKLILTYHNAELHPDFNKIVDQAITTQKEFMKKIRALRGAVKLISNLQPINISAVYELEKYYPDFNERLSALQKDVKEITELYIKFTPLFSSKTGKLSGFFSENWGLPLSRLSLPQKTTSKSKLWNQRIITIVDELKRVGYSDRQAYIKTLEIFSLAFPSIWNGVNNDPDLIRQRYIYHKK